MDKDFETLLDRVPLTRVRSLRRRMSRARTTPERDAVVAEAREAAARVAAIDARIPEITYPESLPVCAKRKDIADAIAEHQVVIIAGETGSGKTTQIPKICLELGRGRRGLIGHTQPRRIAARTVAERIAEELGQPIGESVGYAIRFDDRISDQAAVKIMTDGILLAEMQRDRFFNAYDTLIIDEAHERTLNIDFLLGYLKRLLPRRPDLKLIITSATIDPERFARHFTDRSGRPAPIVEVSGRTYPVEIRYRPLAREEDDTLIATDPIEGLISAIEELMGLGPGDILCFFPGERDIREAMEAVEAKKWKGVSLIPLFGRLSNAEQHKVFSPHAGRRIVFATNIAETSLTVPGIRYVVDTGLARISRYSTRTKVQRLPIEPISQASANQRSGRCGRVAEGVAIRLYAEEDFASRPRYTDPEILRTNLASVILQMALLKLGAIEDFPFVDPPEPRAIRDGIALLHELGALEKGTAALPKLTAIGRDLARIPVDPRLARMLIQARQLACLDEVLVIVAALSIQDIRERPLDHQARVDQLHARFKVTGSDFLSYLSLWKYIQEKRKELSGNQFRKMMKAEFLHYMRSREWEDLVRQLRDVLHDLGWRVGHIHVGRLDSDSIHRSLLSGLLMHIGVREGTTKTFQGTRGTKFFLFPGSSLAKKPPEFVMAGQLIETSRLFAHDVAAIDPAWVEEFGAHLVKYQHSEPFWSRSRAAAMVHEHATFFGVPIVNERTVPLHTVDAQAARDMFIRHALVEGDWDAHPAFLEENNRALADAAGIEEKLRRRGLVADDDVLVDFYAHRLPATATTGAHFLSWWKRRKRRHPNELTFDPRMLLDDRGATAARDAATAFPDSWTIGGHTFALEYSFDPGSARDGVTVLVPVPLLASLDPAPFAWLVPGLREELFTELIRTLPKGLRRTVVPAPDFAAKAAETANPRNGTPTGELARALAALGARGIDPADFRAAALPDHLRITFAAVDRHGKIIDSDKDLRSLARRRAGEVLSSVNKLGATVTASAPRWTREEVGTIPEKTTTRVDGQDVTAYPALVATPEGVAVRVMPTKRAADAALSSTVLTLLMREIPIKPQPMVKGLPLRQRVAVEHYPHGAASGLVDDARVAAIRDAMMSAGGPVRDPDAFATLTAKIKPTIAGAVRRSVVTLAPALVELESVSAELSEWEGPAIDDMARQLAFMVPPRAITTHGLRQLSHLPRYLKAMRIRLEDMNTDPDRDAARQEAVEELCRALGAALPSGGDDPLATVLRWRPARSVGWMIEEFRVSLFAQRLGTAGPVSAKRIRKAIAALGSRAA